MTDPGKKDQWKLKPMGKTLMRNSILHTLKASLQNSFLISEGNEQLHCGEIRQTPLPELKVLIIDKWMSCSYRRWHPENNLSLKGVTEPEPSPEEMQTQNKGPSKKTYSLHSSKTSRGWENKKYQATDPLKETKEVRELTLMGDPGLEERWVGQNAHAIVQKKKNNKKNPEQTFWPT